MRQLFLLAALLLLPPKGFAQAPPSGGQCVRYVYADVKNARNDKVPVYACGRVENKRATDCSRIGTVDSKKLDEAQSRAWGFIVAYGQGMAIAFACYMGVISSPLVAGNAGPTVTGAILADTQTASQRMFDAAKRNGRNGTREFGSAPSAERGEINKSLVIRGCEHLRRAVTAVTNPKDVQADHAHNMGVNAVLDHFQSNAAFVAVLQADAQNIEELYAKGTIQRAEAVRRFRERIRQEDMAQRKILEEVKKYSVQFYRFMTDNSATQVPFGTSPDNVSNDLPCVPAAAIRTVRDKMCELAKATAKIEGYTPGDMFKRGTDGAQQRISDIDAATRAFVEENCKADVAGGPTLIERMDEAPHP